MGDVKRRKLPSRNNGKEYVTLKHWPERTGVIIQRGTEVSQIKFLDGTLQYIVNEHFIEGG